MALSTATLAEATKSSSAICLLELLKISHPATGTQTAGFPLRFCNNTENISSSALDTGSETFTAFPFYVTLPSQKEDIEGCKITIDNVSQEIINAIRPLQTKPKIEMCVISTASPNTVEAGPWSFSLSGIDYDARTITGTLAFDNNLSMNYINIYYLPEDFPGCF